MSPSYPSDRNQWRDVAVERTESNLLMGDWQVMQDWERPLMAHMATAATSPHGDLLEVGFGMGISASMLVAGGCRSYTVIEAHPGIADHARSWAAEQSVSCHVIEGFWQDVVPSLETRYDSILFDTYPMTEKERGEIIFPSFQWQPNCCSPMEYLRITQMRRSTFAPNTFGSYSARFGKSP